ncbi:MAG: DNA polymerase Y family protein [Terracidiphilus sp.]
MAKPIHLGRRAMKARAELAELYACLLVREFPAQALLRLRPGSSEQACVVMEGDPPMREVCSLNRAAQQLGVEHGMTQVEVDTVPGVTAMTRSPKEEQAARAALLECAGCFSPRVEDRSGDRAFRCVIDLAGTRALFGPPETLAQKLLSRVSALRMEACVAVSSNFHTAEVVAKGLPERSRVRVVPPGEESVALAPLPLAVLDLDDKQAGIFASWGIHTLGLLADLPETELIARLGQAGKRLRQLARGQMPHLFQPIEPAFPLEERMDLDSPVEALDALLFVVNLQLDQLIHRASSRMQALAAVTVSLILEGGATHTRTVRPALPTNDRPLWIKLLHLDLEAHPPQAAVLAIALQAEPGTTSKVQLGLFAPQLPEPSRLDVTLARIRALVGEDNAGRAVLEDTHQPDSFRMEPFTISAAKATPAPAPVTARALRPALRRLRPAETVFVTMQAERPVAIIFRSQRYAVERTYGPWQASGQWWSATLWGVEEWDLTARAQDGAMLCCCMVRDLLRDRWQMTGLYD